MKYLLYHFRSVKLVPGEPESIIPPADLRITNIALGDEIADDNARTSVSLIYQRPAASDESDDEDEEEKEENHSKLHSPVAVDGIARSSAPLQPAFDSSTGELTLTGPKYSLRWTAPEVLDNGTPDLPSDMWAMGWIGWEVRAPKSRWFLFVFRSQLRLLTRL